LQRLFLLEASKYNVFPLDDRRVERFNADLAGRPQLIKGNRQLLFGGMGRLSENSVVVTKNKSHSITAQVVVPDGGAEGVMISQGGAFGGWSLYTQQGRPAYCYNLFGLQRFKVYGEQPIPAGEHQVRAEFAYDGGGLAKGGTVTLYVDGVRVGEGRVDATQPMLFSADETTDVGSDSATPVSDDYGPTPAPSAAGSAGFRSTWTPTTTTTSSAQKNASASPWPDSNRHGPARWTMAPRRSTGRCFPRAALGYPAGVADSPLPLTVQESPRRVRLCLGSLAHGDGPTLQDAADDLVQRLLAYVMAFRASGLRAPVELGPPDLAAMELLYQLGEITAAGGDIRSRLFG
jgi:hypothetical protein